MTPWMKSGLMAALLSSGALSMAAAPVAAQTVPPATWYCYVTAESQAPKGLVVTPIFEWTGVGRPPQNVISSQFEKLSRPAMPSAAWPMSSCWKERAKAEQFRSDRLRAFSSQGATIRQIDYAYSGA